MFKSLIIYRISPLWPADLAAIEQALAAALFVECTATQEKSAGFVPPRGDAHGAMVESIGGQWIARYKTEAKAVPGEVLARKVAEKAALIEQETGRKPGRKETKDLKEDAKLELLPMAFAKQASTCIWIDPTARTLVLDTGSQARADDIVSSLVELLPGLSVSLLNTQSSPQACMAHWLKEQEPPTGFTVDRECELKAADESKAVVRYGRHPLDIDEVQQHIDQGKLPTKLALTWDDRVSFVLTEGLQVRKLAFLDTVFEGQKDDDGGFDADVAIATGELCKLIPDLIAALGGEQESGVAGVVNAVQKLDALARKNGNTLTVSTAAGETLATFGAGETIPCPSSLAVDAAGNVTAPAPAAEGEIDPMYQQAVDLVRGPDGRASISYVQRCLMIGYNRAARLMEDMEKAGIVSSMGANGVRKVIA